MIARCDHSYAAVHQINGQLRRDSSPGGGILSIGDHKIGITSFEIKFRSTAGSHAARLSHDIAQKKDFDHSKVFIERMPLDDVKMELV